MEVFLTAREVSAKVSLSRTEIYRRIRAGTFPAPVTLGPQRVAWRLNQVESWMADIIKVSSEIAAPRTRRARG